MSTVVTPRRAQRISHEIHRREVQVRRVESPSPGFRRIVFAGDSLAGFVSLSFDDHLKFIFDDAAGQPQRRDYTPRRYDAARGELTVDFALHGHGPAAAWAAAAGPGQRAVVAGPRGSFVMPLDLDWHLLIGDASALPAVARRLEELPQGSRAIVLLQVATADRVPLLTHADLQLQWFDDEVALLAAARRLALPAGEGQAWCAGEAGTMKALREVLVQDLGLHPHAVRAAAYWKHGSVAHHEPLADVPAA